MRKQTPKAMPRARPSREVRAVDRRVLVNRGHQAGRQRDAAAAVPFDFLDQTSLLGDRARIADRLRVLADVGVTTCSVVPYGDSVEEKLHALTIAAEALELAGVAD